MQRITIFTMQGNTKVVTGGVPSTTLVEGSFPGCTVTVFNTGTITPTTIFGDNLNPPTPKSNPFTADSTGSGFFYAASGSRVDIQLSGTGITVPFVLAGDVLLEDPAASASLTVPNINNRFFVDGVKYPLTQAGVQAAMNDACALDVGQGPNLGGVVVLPPGLITLNPQAGQLLQCNCPIELAGSAGEATIFLLATGTGAGIPVFRFLATSGSGTLFYNIHDIKVQCNVGCPTAGDVFLFDNGGAGAAGPQAVYMRHNSVLPNTTSGFDVSQTGNSTGMFAFHFEDNYFQNGGVKLTTNLADSQYWEHNLFRSTGANPCMDVTTIAGAALGWIFGQNMQCSGGIIKIHGTIQPKIVYNQMETLVNTETNGAMIDFLGDTAAIDGAEVLSNNLNAHTVGSSVIRFGANSTNWRVEGNKIIPNPTAGVGIAVVAGGTGGVVGPNSWTLTGTATTISGDTAAARITVYGNTGAGMPGTRSWAPADGDPAGDFIRNSATQTQGILRVLDETKTMLSQFDSAGRLFIGQGSGSGPLGPLYISTSTPSITLNNSSAGVDAKRWETTTTPTSWIFRTTNDANPVNNALTIWTVNRSGLIPTSIINTPVVQNSFNRVAVATNFTTANNANLQAITGLSWALPAEARNYSFHCALSYSQATALVAVSFGIQASSAPTNIFANGSQQITVGPPATQVNGTLATLTTTVATNIVSGVPGATATNYAVELEGTIEIPATANTITILVSTAAGADAVTVLRGSYCTLF